MSIFGMDNLLGQLHTSLLVCVQLVGEKACNSNFVIMFVCHPRHERRNRYYERDTFTSKPCHTN